MKASFTKDEDGIENVLDGMISRTKTISSYLNRNLFRQYQKAQIARWKTENASEGAQWEKLNPKYAKIKRRKFASYPGGGNVVMVATGKLKDGATGGNTSYFFKKVTNKSFEVSINASALPYAPYPGVLRPYMEFNESTLDKWRAGIRDFISNNVTP